MFTCSSAAYIYPSIGFCLRISDVNSQRTEELKGWLTMRRDRVEGGGGGGVSHFLLKLRKFPKKTSFTTLQGVNRNL